MNKLKAILAVIIAAAIIVCFVPTQRVSAMDEVTENAPEVLYPLCGVVTEVNALKDEVVFTDFNGNEWGFSGTEDWCKGDIVACIMQDNGTESIYDDEVVQARYCGWVY